MRIVIKKGRGGERPAAQREGRDGQAGAVQCERRRCPFSGSSQRTCRRLCLHRIRLTGFISATSKVPQTHTKEP